MIRLLILCFILLTSIAEAQTVSRDSVLLNRGLQAMEQGAYNESIDLFKRLLGTDSLHATAHYYIAQSYDKRGKRVLAAKHAGLAVRHDKKNVDHLILRHQIGFIHPVPLARARKRAVLRRIIAIEPENPYAHTELAREHAQRYLNHKGRVRVTNFLSASSSAPGFKEDPENGIRPERSAEESEVRIRDPFNLKYLRSQGYNTMYLGSVADSSYGVAIAHLTRALRGTPDFVEAYHVLMGVLAMERAHPDMWSWARTMIRFLPENPYSNLYAGYAAYKLEKLALAEGYFEKGIQLLGEHERGVFLDATRVMNKAQARNASVDSINAVSFWAGKDPFFLSSENERILEHYSRLVFSRLIFGEPKLDLEGWDSERGEIYVRYGQPESMYFMTHNVENCGSTGFENIVNFQVFDYGGYQFVFGNLNSSIGLGGQSSVLGIPTLNEFVLYSPCAPMYASRWTAGDDMDYVLKAKSLIRDRPTDFNLGENTVDFPHLAAQFRGEEGRVDLLVAYGLPLEKNTLGSADRGILTTLRMNAGAFLVTREGTQDNSLKSIGRIYEDELIQFDEFVLWTGTHTLSGDPGMYTLSVEFDRYSVGKKGANQVERVLDDYTHDRLAMSDLMLAYSVEEHVGADLPEGYFSRNGLEIKVAPWGLYENNQPVFFYFELYNIPESEDGMFEYDVEASLLYQSRKKGLFRFGRKNKDNAVAVRFTRTHSATDANEYLSLETETLEPGDYLLIVKATENESGATVERRQQISIRKGD